ncbi:MAG: slipin family protein [Leptospiraceae bacterium]|nr:slipin family protein [Leptospiraceae bacterium]MCB1314301.1 slipin family protein [Leptospiraceae bacterium]
MAYIFAFVIGLIALVLLTLSVKVCQEFERAVIFRLGRFQAVKGPGIFLAFPILDRFWKIDLRTYTVDLEPQEAITKDSVSIKANAVLWYRTIDAQKTVVNVEDVDQAVYMASITALRNIIGQHDLDEIIRDRDKINETMQVILDQATDPWGIKIQNVEIKDLEIPVDMQRAMAREAEAIREKRARIIKAQGEYEASRTLFKGAEQMEKSPISLELRRMQMMTEIGVENNTTTIIMMPSEFSVLTKEISSTLKRYQKK